MSAEQQKKPAPPKLAVAPPPAPRSARRAELASAINRHREALRRLGEGDAALHRAAEHMKATAERVEAAEATVAAAKSDTAIHTAAALRKNVEPPNDEQLRYARLDLETATDQHEAAEQAHADIRDALALPKAEADATRRQVNAAVAAVLGEPEVAAALLKRAREIQKELAPVRLALRWLLSNELIRDDALGEDVHRYLYGLDAGDALPGAPAYRGHASSAEQVAWKDHSATQAWDEYRAALGLDADVPPPIDV